MKRINGNSPAKVNLTLDVFQKREGASRHPVRTILHKISLADEIELIEANRFDIQGAFGGNQEDNLIFKAWKLLAEFLENPKPVHVNVEKNIIISAGLGGGSSNFANFVKLYFELFDLGKIPLALIEKAGLIGSDIPFFFSDAKCALGTNFGEIIEPLDFNFSGTEVFLHTPNDIESRENKTQYRYERLTNYNTNYTNLFLVEPGLGICGNAFDEFLPKGIEGHLCGSGPSVFSFSNAENAERYTFL